MNNILKRLNRLGASTESMVQEPATAMPIERVDLPLEEHVVELDQCVAAMEHATTAHEQLSRLAVTLENMAQTNGMTDTEAVLFDHAVGAICDGTPVSSAGPSMESAAHASGQLRNANVALESVGDKLKRVGDWIKKTVAEFLRKLAQLLQNWVQSIDPAIEKIESRDLSILSQLPRSVALELELSEANLLRINDELRTGDYTVNLKKIQHWVGVFTEHIAPDSMLAVEKLLKSVDPTTINSETIKDAISEAYRKIKFEKKDSDSNMEVSEVLFSALVLERQHGGYVRVSTDLLKYRTPGRIAPIYEDQAKEIRELSIRILRDLKVMTNVTEIHRNVFEEMSRTFENTPDPTVERTIVRAIMSNTNDVILKIYREALVVIRTIDSLVVSSLELAAQKAKDSQ